MILIKGLLRSVQVTKVSTTNAKTGAVLEILRWQVVSGAFVNMLRIFTLEHTICSAIL